ncbi:MAG: NAD-binding protein [Sulfurovum sp.]|nr:NAD-binding protein [Sulfurovum sp.]
MDIIIAGAGKVGYNLAKTLSIGHNVTVIDKNGEALKRLQENLDILPIQGNIEDPLTYEKSMDKNIDLFIAVTNSDDANIISTIIANDIITIERKFIRLQNDFFAKSSIKEKIGIDKTVFPIQLTSKSIATLLKYPKANNVKAFKHTEFKLISVRISKNIEPLIPNYNNVALVGIERSKEFIIPQKNELLQPNDLIYLFGNDENIKTICLQLETTAPTKIEKCVIFGADHLGRSIAQVLIENNIEVKIIENDIELCEITEEKLEGKAMVINSKYSSSDMYEDEGLIHADMIIVATNNDEYNIIKAIEAQEHGINKVVVINNDMQYYNIMHSLGLIVVRGPKVSTYHSILEEINTNGIITERMYCGGKSTFYMRKIFSNSRLIGKTIKALKIPDKLLLFIIRDEQLIHFNEKITIEEKDTIAAFCTTKFAHKIKVWMYGL